MTTTHPTYHTLHSLDSEHLMDALDALACAADPEVDAQPAYIRAVTASTDCDSAGRPAEITLELTYSLPSDAPDVLTCPVAFTPFTPNAPADD